MRLDGNKQAVILDDGTEVPYEKAKINRVGNCMTVLNFIRENGFITSDIARDNGVRRLSARIYDLRYKYGYAIKTNMPTTKKDRLARYTL